MNTNHSNTPLILLTGYGRSGCHLMLSLIDGHPRIAAVPEVDYLLRACTNNRRFRLKLHLMQFMKQARGGTELIKSISKNDKWARAGEGFQGESKTEFRYFDYDIYDRGLKALFSKRRPSLWNFCSDYIDVLLSSVTQKYWDREISYRLYFCSHADALARSLTAQNQGHKIIFMLRNPLQVIASLKTHETIVFSSMDRVFDDLTKHYRCITGMKEEFPSSVFVQDYDSLILDTKTRLRKLSEFLAIDYREIMLSPTKTGRQMRSNSSYGPTEGISEASMDKYRTVLNEKEQDLIQDRLMTAYRSVKERETA